uniref:hyaluronidase-4-like n=1 Tax=Myxine glutinosa TaxID=7769 RepID=UPI00358E4628
MHSNQVMLLWISILLNGLCEGGEGGPIHVESILRRKPFIVVWNAPTSECQKKYHVDLDLSTFDIIVNHNESFRGDNISIFYHDKLGFYPFVDEHNVTWNGGIPQNGNLFAHLAKSKQDIENILPSKEFGGIAVIDWEKWRPIWERNWDDKTVYKRMSKDKARKKHPQWPDKKVTFLAKEEFEQAARKYMQETLRLGQLMRNQGLWGFYHFPYCYNHYSSKIRNYTGECPDIEKARNDKLSWLWCQSNILFPSIYLSTSLRSNDNVRKFVKHRVAEAIRVASSQAFPPDILAYSRIVYTFTFDFLVPEDLVHTIGESASQGVAGVILWGDAAYTQSEAKCRALKKYIDVFLGPYVLNVTSAAKRCSLLLCSGNGRCARRHFDSAEHLHLDPLAYHLAGHQLEMAEPSLAKQSELKFQEAFACRCYHGWSGHHCENHDNVDAV